MEPAPTFEAVAIGFVRSSLTDPETAPKQGDEGAPDASIVVAPHALAALRGLREGDDVLVLTWLDRARRDVLEVHPRDDLERELLGVFATRSPHRPNPIGLHRVRILSIRDATLRVRDLEALDGTPVLDLKPVLGSDAHLR